LGRDIPGDAVLCDVLTGYLGSGKTTLLNRYLRGSEASGTAVIVNEIGAIGVDHLILGEVSDNVVLLDSGCLCCSLTGSLRETLLDLYLQAERINISLKKVVIETTGLAEPLPILHALIGDRMLKERFALRCVIVTVDGQQALEQLANRKETARQVAVADVLVITKADLASPTTLEALKVALSAINGCAAQIDSSSPGAVNEAFDTSLENHNFIRQTLQIGQGPYLERSHRVSLGGQPIGAESFWISEPTTWPGIAAWWNLLVTHYGKNLLRCKGLLSLADQPSIVLLQGVGTYLHKPEVLGAWPGGDDRARLTVIGEGLDRQWLASSLRALRLVEPGLLPTTLAELDQLGT
jgi:G3E family GTPase